MNEFDELPPLRKTTISGRVQVRRARTVEQIQRAKKHGYANLLERVEINDRSSPDYVVSEVLVFLMRETKTHNNRALFDKLFFVLWQRIKRSFPWYIPGQDGTDDSSQLQMEDMVLDSLGALIASDQADYDEDLDYYEVSFDQAIKFDRIDAWRSVMGNAAKRVSMTTGDEEERLTAEVKTALTKMASDDFVENEEKIYLKESLRAISQLPEKEREVMLYKMKQYPIESTDPSIISISSILKCTPKTVQNRLKSARSRIKKMLGEE
ncbi:hypothetical protein SAMN04488118_101446 [Epibacterium ulvae]|uniref:Uncharacterized protein n=1 Tax=Epibacterium ulvae TaxID=1156985 RepID=A0A1G5PPK4_9RHOB|nr:sigma-70 family RNA polymerase sigma factor [Epibacterium ulvae]SCZ51246.1 hypothetical protein SAMN04488118_101446 [Epibacterium ulvae]